MPGEMHGEYIDLQWEGWPDFYAVRGWVSDQDASDAVAAYVDDLHEDPNEPVIRQLWGRWSQDGYTDWSCTLSLHWGSGRGRFPVTVVWSARLWRVFLDTNIREFEAEVARG